jgi:alpha-L-rhamnosidase
MDCPSRERAGWLCDSFFTSRVEKVLTGESKVERAFLENFLLPDAFRNLPRGMLPMCYPSDFYNGEFIPNWAMWYVLELCEYVKRTGDTALAAQAKYKMDELDRYLRRFENEYGLLEKLEAWVFVEWSMANKLVQDVSFATNMLYVGYKRAMAELYGDARQRAEADRLVETIRTMALCADGFFCDNAVRTDGKLILSGECTEACQYYAFFFDIATPQRDPDLWRILLNEFGPDRAKKGLYPKIHPANAFIGNYLRLDVLCRYHCNAQLLENISGYFHYMADQTGTLWENITSGASCNHGFASHVLYWMDQLGLLTHEA